ncbi:Lysophospholipase, alpha-beta hydrolase superfamily [Fervidobacterium changbaicum]|uniref:Alpha/beta hydrolase n=1 Tax=Fervidobacterium changbaicum TaxID=310769 RepID=A0ABX5QTE8_9BACT|nr:alpha/beta hydrolase [Fervidobacterium changbaicum]QAV33710.1 alpha/beta hydrolase [Fervidobacterium changbaicum]SDH40975.1 Lysophospholipase, alpha-beta hydrolase superfamily [Fervidobacterium changbaicum]
MVYHFKKGSGNNGWVVIVHGLGEHIGRYERLIQLLAENDYGVIGFDLPGHGKSSGKRGHTSIEEVIDLIDEVTKSVNSFVLFGHSLGGLIAVRYTEERPTKVSKLIVSSPALYLEPKPNQVMMLKLFSFLAPSMTVKNGIDPNLLSRNKDAVHKYITDPLVHDRISIRLGKSMLQNVQLAHERASRIKCPVAILVGTDDKVTPPHGARNFYEQLDTKKAIEEFEGGYHELFEDPEYGEQFHKRILYYIKDWESKLEKEEPV